MERWRAVIPIAVALIIAVVASVFLYKWMKKQVAPEKEVVKKEVKTMNVAVAGATLQPGNKITAAMIKEKTTLKTAPFLEESLPPGYFKNLDDLKGRIIRTPIKAKELILESKLAPIDVKRGGLSAILEPGKRAVSVSGNKVLGLSGFVQPRDRVDILLLTTDPKTKEKVNKTIFENVLILATGSQLVENAEGKPSPVDIYTLEVTPEQGEQITLAAASGKMQFSLRSVLDRGTVLTTGATTPEILAAYRPIDPTPRVPSKNAVVERTPSRGLKRAPTKKYRKGFTLEIIKGLNRTVQKY